MRLYVDVSTLYAQRLIAEGGFTGEPHILFRDKQRSGPTFTVSDGEVLAEEPGGFILSIDVPDGVALAREAPEDPSRGSPFREFQFTEEEANRYLDTLKIFDPAGAEVRPDRLGN